MCSRQDGRRCECITPRRPEEEFGIPLRNPTFRRWLDRVPPATWLDPPDECAAAALPKQACHLLDRSHICDTIPRTGVTHPFLVPARPNPPYGYASPLPPNGPPSCAAVPPPAFSPRCHSLVP